MDKHMSIRQDILTDKDVLAAVNFIESQYDTSYDVHFIQIDSEVFIVRKMDSFVSILKQRGLDFNKLVFVCGNRKRYNMLRKAMRRCI